MPDSSARSRPDAAATRRWVDRLERFSAGRHTVVAFCAAEGVSESNFFLWRRRLAQPPKAAAERPKVVPLRVTPPPAPAAAIELALTSGTVLRLTGRNSGNDNGRIIAYIYEVTADTLKLAYYDDPLCTNRPRGFEAKDQPPGSPKVVVLEFKLFERSQPRQPRQPRVVQPLIRIPFNVFPLCFGSLV